MIASARCLPRVFSFIGVLGAIAAAALPATSRASVMAVSGCGHAAVSRPFGPWGDRNLYQSVQGGSFESSLAGWSLRGGARRARGGASLSVGGAVGSYSLLLPRGGSATSPQTCINASYRSFRLFARALTPGARLTVAVSYPSAPGSRLFAAGKLSPGGIWRPTAPLSIGSAVPVRSASRVSFRFATIGGAVEIDDVLVDPHGRCC